MILKYQKVFKKYDDRHSTTITLVEPNYKEDDPRVTELCTIGKDTFVHIPDDLVLPEQPFNLDVTMEAVTLTDELRTEIKAVSPHVRLINARVVEKIRAKYSENDEFKMLRVKADGEQIQSKEYSKHVESCTAWGLTEKGKMGL